jgi:nitroreductase
MFIDLLRARRSVRSFTGRPISAEHIDLLAEAVLRSPSSRGRRPWEFVFVTNPEAIARLAATRPTGSAFLAGAALVIVVCARPSVSDVWVEDASIATLIAHLSAADLGLGSCWVQVRQREHDDMLTATHYVAEVIGLPPDYEVEAMVGIGHPNTLPTGHPAPTLNFAAVHHDRHGAPLRVTD